MEYQKVGDEEWKRANHTPESCPETNYKVTGLRDGQSYKFRVIAVNAAGESDPAHVPEPVLVKDRLGEYTHSQLPLQGSQVSLSMLNCKIHEQSKSESTILFILEPPELILDANMAREQHIRVGDTLRLSAIIKGVPFPKVTWKKEDREAPTKARIDVTPVGSKLEIRNAAHEDGGIYSLTVENPAGSKTVSVKVLVLGENFSARDVLNATAYKSNSIHFEFLAGLNHLHNCVI